MRPIKLGIGRGLRKSVPPYAPVTLGTSVDVAYPSGRIRTPTTSRTTDLWLEDHEGILRQFESNEVGIVNGRVVRNLADNSENFTGWNNGQLSNGTRDTNGWTLTGGIGYAYYTSTFTLGSGSYVSVSFNIDSYTGSPILRISQSSNGAIDDNFTVTGTGKHSLLMGPFSAIGAVEFGLENRSGFGGDDSSASSIVVSGIQIENVTAQANQNPSEYVSSADGGLAVYATENGNSVASNIVTESVGALLDPAPSIWCQPAATNLVTYSEEFDNAAWTKTNATITANDTTAPDGTLTADKIVEDSSTSTHHIIDNVTVTANPMTVTVFAKAAERDKIGIYPYSSAAGAKFNLSDGTVISASGGITASIDEYANGWYRCRATITAPGTAAGGLIYVLDASGNASYAGDGSSGLYVWGAVTEQSSYPTSYIPTSGATATVNATEPTVAWPSGLVNDFVVKFKGYHDPAQFISHRTFFSVGAALADSLYVRRTENSDQAIAIKRIGNTLYGAQITPTWEDREYEYVIRCSSVNGVAFWLDGVKGSTNSSTTDCSFDSSGGMEFGQLAGNNPELVQVRDLKIHRVSPTITDAEVLSL